MSGPVFIVGSPRSGTTLLYHMILSSGGFAIYHAEASAYDLIGPRYSNLRTDRARREFLDTWTKGFMFSRTGLDEGSIREKILNCCNSTGDFLRILMEEIAAAQGVERWAECTPANALYISRIHRDFPNARILHMIRDGRDVAISMARQGWIKRLALDRAPVPVASALYWQWIVRKGRALGRPLGEHYKEVRYEDLVERPETVLESIGSFIDHKLEYQQILRDGVGTVRQPNSSFDQQQSFSPIGRWRNAPADLVDRLTHHIGKYLSELGYPVSPAAGTPVLASARTFLYTTNFTAKQFLRSRSTLAPYLISEAPLIRPRP